MTSFNKLFKNRLSLGYLLAEDVLYIHAKNIFDCGNILKFVINR